MGGELERQELDKLDKATLITLLINSNASLKTLRETVDRLNKNIDILTEEVRGLRANRFGRSSEKNLVPDGTYEQLSFSFNEAEGTVDFTPDIPEPTIEEIHPKAYIRGKKKVGKREEELDGLPVKIINHELSEEELLKRFPDGKWTRLPDRIYRKLEFHPASFEVAEHHIASYKGSDKTFVRAQRPAELFENSIATASLVAGIWNFKYVNSQPINRLADEFRRNGVDIPTQTLCRWMINSSDRYVNRVYDVLKKKLLDYHVIHADETPVEVNRDGRPAGSKSYMWVYRSGALEPHPFVLYEYQKTRKADHPKEFLKDFKGICVTDGYQVYHTIADEREDLKIAGCWAHARRGFADVIKASPSGDPNTKDSIAYKALKIIQTMYRIEKSYAGKTSEERLEARQKDIAPLVDAFFAYIKTEEGKVAPKSRTGKAIQYCINQENYLRVFLTDGCVPMDNNAAERGIRTFCLGKKNWYLIDTVSGARSSAVLYSIAETARANGLNPYEYFNYLLEELPKHGEFEDTGYIEDLLPWSEKLPEKVRKRIKV